MKKFDRFKTWLRQLFCRHEWVAIGEATHYTTRYHDGVLVEFFNEDRECTRCHKRINYSISVPHS